MLLQQLGQPAPTFLPLPRPWRDLITIASTLEDPAPGGGR
jgi:hypothetical protein